jgi:hypothetical protein
MIPPPNTLIKEKLARFKNEEFFEKNLLPSKEAPETQDDASVELLKHEPKAEEIKAEETPPAAEEKGLDS